MSDPIQNPVLPPSVADAIAPTVDAPAQPPVTPTAAVSEPPSKAPIPKEASLSDAIAIRLGEKDPVVVPAEPVKPAPAEATPPSDDDATLVKEIESTKLSGDQRKAFERKTYELRDANRKIKQFEADLAAKLAEVEAAKAAAATPVVPEATAAELAALKTKLTDYEQRVAAADLESTDVYRSTIAGPLESALAVAKAATTAHEIAETDLVAAWNMVPGVERDTKLNEILSSMSDINKTRLVQAVLTADGLREKAAGLKANAKQSLEQLRAAGEAKAASAAAARKAEYEAAAKPAWENIIKQVPLAAVEGNEAWNKGLETAQTFANYEFEKFDVPSQVAIMQRAGAFPLLAGLVQSLKAENAALAEKVGKLTAASPAAGGGNRPTIPSETENESFTAAIDRRLRAAGLS